MHILGHIPGTMALEEGRSVQVGNAGRQLSEYILKQILPTPAKQSLFDRIDDAITVSVGDQIDNLTNKSLI
jgi:hypothetical protein